MEALKKKLSQTLKELVQKLYGIEIEIPVELPPQPELGDYAAPIGFKLAKLLKRDPEDISFQIRESLLEENKELIEKVDAVKGYVNIFLNRALYSNLLLELSKDPLEIAKIPELTGKKILIEFVSANPTGPLNIANARAASVGDTLARIMRFLKIDIETEYYVNDGGGQIKALEKTIAWHLGELSEFPKDGYKGNYMVKISEMAKKLPEGERGKFAVQEILKQQFKDLEDFGVTFDNVYFESWFHEGGKFENYTRRIVEAFKNTKLPGSDEYMAHPIENALCLRTDLYGDDEKPRVLIRSNGQPTYFLYDLAYHLNKIERGYDILLDLWGPDHQGHVKRMKIALDMLGYALKEPEINGEKLKVLIVQQVNLKRGNEKVRMSKREGIYYTLRDLLEEVGKDASRFFFLLRSASSPLDFDLELAKKLSFENPIYYVQYMHARSAGIIKFANNLGLNIDGANPQLLDLKEEKEILRDFLVYPDMLNEIVLKFEPHRLPHYLIELAQKFHSYYQKHRIVGEDKSLSRARLLLVVALKNIVKNGLNLMGVGAPEEM